MRDQLRLVAWLLMVVGGLILVVSALADPLALGMPGSSFGFKQLAGCVLGALIAFGGWRAHRRLDRADARARQRAQQRAQQQRQTAAAAQRPLGVTPTPSAPTPAPAPASTQQAMTRATPPTGYTDGDDAPPAPPAPQIRSNLAETRAMADTTELPRLPAAQPQAHAWADDDAEALDKHGEPDASSRVRERGFDAGDDTEAGTGRGSGRR